MCMVKVYYLLINKTETFIATFSMPAHCVDPIPPDTCYENVFIFLTLR